jgi:hypothetical protein
MNPLRMARLALLLTASGCATPGAPSEFIDGCRSATVGPLSGVTPHITWPEDCGVAVIAVVPAELHAGFGTAVWAISGDGNNIIRSGVTYGQEPDLARTWVQPSPLTPGRTYRVEVRVRSFSTLAWGGVAGSREFIP